MFLKSVFGNTNGSYISFFLIIRFSICLLALTIPIQVIFSSIPPIYPPLRLISSANHSTLVFRIFSLIPLLCIRRIEESMVVGTIILL